MDQGHDPQAATLPTTRSSSISRRAYKVWDQRLCLVPDGDLFASIRSGKTSVATGAIERFTPTGLRLVTGEEVEADVIVTATGLVVKLFGGVQLTIDGEKVNPSERISGRA